MTARTPVDRTIHDLTTSEYHNLAEAFDHFNRRLFGGNLPPCLITLARKSGARGYYANRMFEARGADDEGHQDTDEIALNPSAFRGRTDAEILSTLVHEQCHLWQYHFGKPGRRAYHNREWAARMEALGLMPSDTGEPGGKRTGQSMTHYILAGGPFDLACQELLAGGYRLAWQSRDGDDKGKGRGKDPSKVKYSCPLCGLNAWAKQAANLTCGDCSTRMLAEDDGTAAESVAACAGWWAPI